MVMETTTLIDAVKKMYPVHMFFKNRYFPDGKVYYSEKALIEMKEGGKDIAPFVIPVSGGIPMKKQGYRAFEVKAPYIAPTMPITADDLEKKAFGESPESGRTPEDREDEVQAECMDEMRGAIERRKEKMCIDILTTGRVLMKHYATGNDAAKDKNAQEMILQFYDEEGGFQNKFQLQKEFSSMSGRDKMQLIYDMAMELNGRGVKATDLILTKDVGPDFFLDKDVLEYFNIRRVDFGSMKPEELPDGVMSIGVYNISGIALTIFIYDNNYKDLDGTEKEFLPKGTIAMLKPAMGTTVYSQVTLVEKEGRFSSYAAPIVPRVVYDTKNNMAEVQMFSRPVPYPHDRKGWLVANIYDKVSKSDISEPAGQEEDSISFKSTEEINAMTKAQLLEYGESIGVEGLTSSMLVDEIRATILDYQAEVEDGVGA